MKIESIILSQKMLFFQNSCKIISILCHYFMALLACAFLMEAIFAKRLIVLVVAIKKASEYEIIRRKKKKVQILKFQKTSSEK